MHMVSAYQSPNSVLDFLVVGIIVLASKEQPLVLIRYFDIVESKDADSDTCCRMESMASHSVPLRKMTLFFTILP